MQNKHAQFLFRDICLMKIQKKYFQSVGEGCNLFCQFFFQWKYQKRYFQNSGRIPLPQLESLSSDIHVLETSQGWETVSIQFWAYCNKMESIHTTRDEVYTHYKRWRVTFSPWQKTKVKNAKAKKIILMPIPI